MKMPMATMLLAVFSIATTTTFVQATPASLGTLLYCDAAVISGHSAPLCWWADYHGRAVSSATMLRQLMTQEGLEPDTFSIERERAEEHIRYLEEVQRLAQAQNVVFSHRMGLNTRHLVLDMPRKLSPEAFVLQELHAMERRRLEAERQAPEPPTKRRLSSSVLSTLNWCSTNNPLGKSVCSSIKSQSKCGSCWAFAASDAIEMAVGVATNSSATALSPQQFLDCSDRQMTSTFTYCWVSDSGATGNTWLKKTMKWASKNDACDGGMTHGAFQDAAQKQWGLVSNLYLPYNETSTTLSVSITGVSSVTTLTNSSSDNTTCGANEGHAVASIESWTQAVGTDCTNSSDPIMMLKLALQNEPISAAVSSADTFKDYKGGVYTCPSNGEFTNGTSVDHAVVLVGYDEEDGVEYWIVKNSYGNSWGEQGYLHLKMDSKINCGLNVFPVVPVGAKKGSAVATVDGGGAEVYLGLSTTVWIGLAVAVTIATIVLTIVGITISRRRQMAMRHTHA